MPNSPRAKVRPDGTCTRCNTVHKGCAAHNNRGQACGLHSIRGGDVCHRHGGATPAAKRKAARTRAAVEAAAALARAAVTLGLALDISPTDALLGEVAMTAGHVQWLRGKVRELDASALAWGTTERKVKDGLEGVDNWDHEDDNEDDNEDDTGGRKRKIGVDWGTTTTEKATPSIWYELYSRERDRLIKVCSEAIRAGIEERKVQLAESQGALVAEAIRRILQDLGLSPEQESRVSEVVPRHLRALGGGS